MNISTEQSSQDSATTNKRSKWNRNTRLAGLSAALVMGLNWCHPPTPDINIFHRNNGGQQAEAVLLAE